MNFSSQRSAMVAKTIAGRGITNSKVLEAMSLVPREHFVPAAFQEDSYQDSPLYIGEGQTISQPYIVALMAEALDLDPTSSVVLDVGTGSGYAAAVLSHLAKEVYSVELIPTLAETAKERLKEYTNVKVYVGDGSVGVPQQEDIKFDGIAVAAGAPRIPLELVNLLKAPGGRIVIPVGEELSSQTLVLGTRMKDGEMLTQSLGGVRFVPLVGQGGFN